jgi:hypothetical protein
MKRSYGPTLSEERFAVGFILDVLRPLSPQRIRESAASLPHAELGSIVAENAANPDLAEAVITLPQSAAA